MRSAVEVRNAERDDLVAVARRTVEARAEAAYGLQAAGNDTERLLEHLSTIVAAGGQVLVAAQDGEICGFMVARVVGPHLFADTPALYIDTIYVAEGWRRRGVGHALVGRAAKLAAQAGAPQVYCSPLPAARSMQRFLARLGFAPVAGHRVVSTPCLQRRLTQDASVGPRRDGRRDSRRESSRASIEDLIARRRRARAAGIPSGPVDLREFQERHREARNGQPGLPLGGVSVPELGVEDAERA